MSRLFTEFYFKDQVEYPDYPPTSKTEISNCASDVKKLSSAIDGVQLFYLSCRFCLTQVLIVIKLVSRVQKNFEAEKVIVDVIRTALNQSVRAFERKGIRRRRVM